MLPLSRSLTLLLYYFDTWGFCTELSSPFHCKYFSEIVFVAHNAFLLFALIFAIYEANVDDILSSQEHLVNDAMKTHFAMLTHWIIIIEAFCSRSSQRIFWSLINQAQQNGFHRPIELRRFTIFYILSALLVFIQECVAAYNHPHLLKRWIYSLIFGIFHQMYLNRIHFYMLHVEIVRTFLEQITDISRIPCADASDCTKFRKNCELISVLVESINKIFGWSNAASILFSFNLLLAISNWSITVVPNSPPFTSFGK